MQPVVITVEALRCWQCQRLLHPSEPFFRRQMMTAIETGGRLGSVERWERVNICPDCQAFFQQVEAQDWNRKCWWWLWFWSVLAALIVPYGMLPLGGAIIWRNVWKWQAKRRPKSTLSQADRRKVPPTNAPSDVATGLTKGESA